MVSQPPDDVPPPGALGSDSNLTKIGLLLWVAVGLLFAVFLFTDVGGSQVESTFATVFGLGAAVLIALLLGAVVYQILKRLNLVGGLLANVFWGILLSLTLPLVGFFLIQELGLLSGSVVGDMVDALPINDRTRSTIGPILELLRG
ncbi:hypothetical protein EGH24_03800 [Halonotius terrestris]|uniref:Uncharacterized protein n=1 Tax=Halonotius terrestris TaxID=2487750 RepID=A0A8J8PA43_9EURY|nr:hypothetical protein [Halonotius terrestris]TQQ82585.1 hypothetical protein EGH24_03800 [Halonotius terrestris]